MKKKTTIYDVAEEADVSLATVSRVINGSNVVIVTEQEEGFLFNLFITQSI